MSTPPTQLATYKNFPSQLPSSFYVINDALYKALNSCCRISGRKIRLIEYIPPNSKNKGFDTRIFSGGFIAITGSFVWRFFSSLSLKQFVKTIVSCEIASSYKPVLRNYFIQLTIILQLRWLKLRVYFTLLLYFCDCARRKRRDETRKAIGNFHQYIGIIDLSRNWNHPEASKGRSQL